MSSEILVLSISAASLGFFHTLLGPDHYLPFIVLGKANRWSLRKSFVITFLCGLGHIGSSVALGFLGVILGIGIHKLTFIESTRGDIAAWLLLSFGILYTLWGIRKAIQNRTHVHGHYHEDGSFHYHDHGVSQHQHARKKNTAWILFIIFVFGPCEPLIPLLMYPAAHQSFQAVFLVAGIFGTVTLATMLTVVGLSLKGISLLPTTHLERYSHALAGLTITLCAGAIFLGL